MFTGIIETTGHLLNRRQEGTNIVFRVQSHIAPELKIDQSVAHDGVCLTVVATGADWHEVVAIQETLKRTALDQWHEGRRINLERALPAHGRLDGHIVQGHVDATGMVRSITDMGGSWHVRFSIPPTRSHLLVDKGSVCINGISLTVVEPTHEDFGVAIIPYTWQHTNIGDTAKGDLVNLEFDIVAKYIARLSAAYL
jgi:riboflavin synthase